MVENVEAKMEQEHEEKPQNKTLKQQSRFKKERQLKSVNGYVLAVTGLHQETQEDELLDKFCEFGEVQNLTMNLDRKTGFAKGYALVEFATYEECEQTIKEYDGTELLGKKINVDFAFKNSR